MADDATPLAGTGTDSTPRPTATPRATAQPVDVSALSFAVFVAHVGSSSSEIGAGLQTVSADATAVDIEALTTSSIDLWVLLGEEEAWLDDNPPASCYAELHAAYSRAVSTLYEALDLISDAIGRRRTAARGK